MFCGRTFLACEGGAPPSAGLPVFGIFQSAQKVGGTHAAAACRLHLKHFEPCAASTGHEKTTLLFSCGAEAAGSGIDGKSGRLGACCRRGTENFERAVSFSWGMEGGPCAGMGRQAAHQVMNLVSRMVGPVNVSGFLENFGSQGGLALLWAWLGVAFKKQAGSAHHKAGAHILQAQGERAGVIIGQAHRELESLCRKARALREEDATQSAPSCTDGERTEARALREEDTAPPAPSRTDGERAEARALRGEESHA